MPVSATLLLAALLLPVALRPLQEGDAARVQDLFDQARYGEALEQARQLSDPVLAAEWRTYLRLAGGDYPGALRAARRGLELAPEHRGLLVNAINVALTVGLPQEALAHLTTLERVLDRAAEGATSEDRERMARLREAALAQEALASQGRASRRLARFTVLGALALVVGGMLLLSLRPARPPALRTGPARPSPSPDR